MTRGIFVPGAVGFVPRSSCSVSAGMTRCSFVRRLVCIRHAIGYGSVSAGMTRCIFVPGAVGFVTRSHRSVSFLP